MYNKVGRAPTALNFADDTGVGTPIGYSLREHGPQNGGCCRPKTAIKSIQSTIMPLL